MANGTAAGIADNNSLASIVQASNLTGAPIFSNLTNLSNVAKLATTVTTTVAAILPPKVNLQSAEHKDGSDGLSTEEEVGIWGSVSLVVLILCLVTAFFLLRFWGSKALGKAIETGIETADMHYLGVNVEIENLKVHPCHGTVMIDQVVVSNPAGYHSEYLAKIGKVVLDVDMHELVASRGKKVVIEKAILKGCDIIFETKFTYHFTSNLQEVIAHVQGGAGAYEKAEAEGGVQAAATRKSWLDWCTSCGRHQPTQVAPAAPPAPAPEEHATVVPPMKVMMMRQVQSSEVKEGYTAVPVETATPGNEKAPLVPKTAPHEQDKVEVVLKELTLEDIGVKVAVHALGGRGQYTDVADIHFDDLDKKLKEMQKDTASKTAGVALVIGLVLTSIEKSIVANVMGKSYADARF